jgi:plasmid maintenance system antidote protein VapI
MTEKTIEIEHPGILLKEDFLDAMAIKPGTLARSIGVDRTASLRIRPCHAGKSATPDPSN